VDFAAMVLILTGAFLLGLTVSTFVAAVRLHMDFYGLAVFVVAVTFGCSGASVTG
jgi:hypothetical protein